MRGFTLLEILVVIAILGVVASLAVALVGPDERTYRCGKRSDSPVRSNTRRNARNGATRLLGVSTDRRWFAIGAAMR